MLEHFTLTWIKLLEHLGRAWLKHDQQILLFVSKICFCFIILLGCKLTAHAFTRTLKKTNPALNGLDPTLIPVLCTCLTYLSYMVGMIFVLDIFGINTTSFITLLGAAGLAIGFALKDTLSNIAAGIMLLFLRPFRLNDFIEFNSITGIVKEVSLFTTILETSDGLYISSPNGLIWNHSITNHTRNGKRRISISINIAHQDPLTQAMQILQNIIISDTRLLQQPEGGVFVDHIGPYSVQLTIKTWVPIECYWQLLSEITQRVKQDLEAAGFQTHLPQQALLVSHPIASPST